MLEIPARPSSFSHLLPLEEEVPLLLALEFVTAPAASITALEFSEISLSYVV